MFRALMGRVDSMQEETNNVSGEMETIWWMGEEITELEDMSAESSKLKCKEKKYETNKKEGEKVWLVSDWIL